MGCPLKEYPSAAPATAPEPSPEVIILDDNGAVMFAFDSADLTPAAQQRLQGLVAKLDSPTIAG